MSGNYSSFAAVSQYYLGTAGAANQSQQDRFNRLGTTASVLEELLGNLPQATQSEQSTGRTVEDVMVKLEEKGIPKRSRESVMNDIRLIGSDIGIRLYLRRRSPDPYILYDSGN